MIIGKLAIWRVKILNIAGDAQAKDKTEPYANIRLLELSGSPVEMGQQHGRAYPNEIRELTEDRLQLSSSKNWTGQELSRRAVLALGRECLPHHQAYAPDLMDELRGVGQVTGLGLAELVILNGFTDFIDIVYSFDPASLPAWPALDDCTAFIVNPDVTAKGEGFFGQTWDMHETATPYMILLRGKTDFDQGKSISNQLTPHPRPFR